MKLIISLRVFTNISPFFNTIYIVISCGHRKMKLFLPHNFYMLWCYILQIFIHIIQKTFLRLILHYSSNFPAGNFATLSNPLHARGVDKRKITTHLRTIPNRRVGYWEFLFSLFVVGKSALVE